MGFYEEQVLPRCVDLLLSGRQFDELRARVAGRFTPLQRRIAGGCHLNRPVTRLITEAGLVISDVENFHLKGPKMFGCMYQGVAIKA